MKTFCTAALMAVAATAYQEFAVDELAEQRNLQSYREDNMNTKINDWWRFYFQQDCGAQQPQWDPMLVGNQTEVTRPGPNQVFNNNYTQFVDDTTGRATAVPKGEHKFTLIWLHGQTGTGDRAKGLFAGPIPTVPPTTKIILPTARENYMTNNNAIGNSWFDLWSQAERTGNETTEEFREGSCAKDIRNTWPYIHSLINQAIEELDGDASKVFVGGISQGHATMLPAFLTYSDATLGGAFFLGGSLPIKLDYDMEVDLDIVRNVRFEVYNDEAESAAIFTSLAQASYSDLEDKGLDYAVRTGPYGFDDFAAQVDVVRQFF